MPKYGKLILEGLGVVLAAGLIIFFVGMARSSNAGANAQVSETNPGQSAAIGADSNEDAYACPMHPDQTTNDPEGKCPICLMKVVAKDQIQSGGQTSGCPMHPDHNSQNPDENNMPSGMDH